MTSRLSKLAVAAALAAALPALAAAHDCDDAPARDGRPVVVTPVYTPAPPAYAPPAYAPPAYPPYRGEGWEHRRHELRWRDRELAGIRADLARLDAERADFHAQFAYLPGMLRRYDRRYFERRMQLERREHELAWMAWR
jgi:hypothetical protein